VLRDQYGQEFFLASVGGETGPDLLRGHSRTSIVGVDPGERGRNRRCQDGAVEIGLNFERPSEFFQTLSYARQSHANVSGFPEAIENLARDPHSEILHCKGHH
jgi:hypothetical protein